MAQFSATFHMILQLYLVNIDVDIDDVCLSYNNNHLHKCVNNYVKGIYFWSLLCGLCVVQLWSVSE